jgi:hypothetical protein
MIYNSVAEIYEMIDKTRSELKQRLSGLTDEQTDSRGGGGGGAAGNGWSVAEIVEHLVTVENGVVRLAGKLLAHAETGGVKSDGLLKPPISFVEQARSIENRKLEAPERVRPRGAQSIHDSLTKLDENRRALNELRPRIEAIDSTATAFPHPFFGNLNLYQWLVMIGMHEARHLQQIEAILLRSNQAEP